MAINNLEEKLKKIVDYTYKNVKFYRAKMELIGLNPSDIKSIEDFKKLPFMEKKDFRENNLDEVFAVPMKKVVRVFTSSGTSGQSTIVGLTQHDYERQKALTEKLTRLGGVEQDDVVQVLYSLGLFSAGLGVVGGLKNIGATMIPTGAGNTDKQIEYIKKMKTSVLMGTPSYIGYIGENINKEDLKNKLIKIKSILVGGEGISEEYRNYLKKVWNTKIVVQNYGFSEAGGTGFSGECIYENGLHLTDDFYPEIIDSNNNNLPFGKSGELVITTLDRECMPLIRYKTHDITYLTYEKCLCGEEGFKLHTIEGRTDDMLKVKGICFYPSFIESIILDSNITTPFYEIVIERDKNIDKIKINIELIDDLEIFDKEHLKEEKQKIETKLKKDVGIFMNINFVNPKTLQRTSGKSKKVKDLRLK